MDTSRHRRDEHRSYRSRSPSRPHSHAMSTSHSPRSQHSRRRDHYRHTSDERDVRSHSAERRKRAHSRREHERRAVAAPATLPFDARPLSKHDLQVLEPMFALYLDIQKNIDIADLDEREVKGRWKSFVGKWNRGELAEGWYDPSTFQKAQQDSAAGNYWHGSTHGLRASPEYGEQNKRSVGKETSEPPRERSTSTAVSLDQRTKDPKEDEDEDEDDDEEEESYGPKLPTPDPSLAIVRPSSSSHRADEKSGPTIPTLQDLQLQRESQKQSQTTAFITQRKETSLARAAHKAQIRAAEEEIAPRAEPGTRERRLEKRREAAAANRAFAESKAGGDDDGIVNDDELMGGGGGGDDLASLKKQREKEMRKKNEREIRREEMLRARAAEREERLKAYRKREEETMSVLRELAKQRFGS
ncbi:predicted protein [Histoplasma capsulatum G186AR]|uniref:RNA helicase HEL117 n=2 Tax=Ajellomyces capsulatus TaxID=5037 RepID=C0NV76_AJECG|nr:uncharacterized protein HCBG_06840 [Histoplasma capsulatum G186AR]EEH04889.1 predicted protein [Histoplasma capsulatum G186AR]